MDPDNHEPAESGIVAARLAITPALEVRVLAQTYKGHMSVHIREYALTNENKWVATQKGVAFPASKIEGAIVAVRELGDAAADEDVLNAIKLSGGREVRFGISRWQGARKADIRQYFTADDSSDLKPTKKGIRLSIALVPELTRALEALAETLRG